MFSKYTLLFTRRTTIFLYAIAVILMLFVLGLDVFQTTSSYLAGTGFDILAVDYASEVIFFLPFYIVAGLMIRLLIERARTFQRTKRLFHIAEYTPQQAFSPAMAGLLIDNDIRTEEVVATLFDLQARGIVDITESQVAPLITAAPVSSAEKLLLNTLFARNGVFLLDPESGVDFLRASEKFRKAVRAEMREKAYLPMPRFKHAYTRWIITGCFMLATYVSVVLVVYMLIDPNQVLQINYPRYQMYLWQPVMSWLFTVLVVAIGLPGFFAETFGTDGAITWRYVAGYRLYVDTVFRGKFSYDAPKDMSREMQATLPYAIAFGIEKKPVVDFVQKLHL